MTVQDLIDKLIEIEDKEREITVFIGEYATYKPYVLDNGSGNIAIGN